MIRQFLRRITRKSESAGISMAIAMRGLKQRGYIPKVVYDIGAADGSWTCQALAIINSPLFEGWSTTVEKAKAIGKSVVLSDIPVLREQNPGQARYFPAHDGGSLGGDFVGHVDAPEHRKPEPDKFARQQADQCMMDFAARYQEIVLSVARGAVHKGGLN